MAKNRRIQELVAPPELGPDFVPPCIICGHSGQSDRVLLHLTHGVAVWLCAVHSSERFLRRRDGTDFAQRLLAKWAAGDSATARKIAALKAHVQHVRNATIDRSLPGSYSWPKLRREAERRFAAGEDPSDVIDELRANYVDGPAMVPSIRTMRRWFTDGRWRSARKPHYRVKPQHAPLAPKRPRLRDDRTYRAMLCAAFFPWISYHDP
jgi:hypothetical protein